MGLLALAEETTKYKSFFLSFILALFLHDVARSMNTAKYRKEYSWGHRGWQKIKSHSLELKRALKDIVAKIQNKIQVNPQSGQFTYIPRYLTSFAINGIQ